MQALKHALPAASDRLAIALLHQHIEEIERLLVHAVDLIQIAEGLLTAPAQQVVPLDC